MKIEAPQKQGVIRVEGELTTSSDVVRMLVHMLERIKIASVPIDALEAKTDGLPAKRLDDAYVEEIKRLTSTVIVKPTSRRPNASREVGFQNARVTHLTKTV